MTLEDWLKQDRYPRRPAQGRGGPLQRPQRGSPARSHCTAVSSRPTIEVASDGTCDLSAPLSARGGGSRYRAPEVAEGAAHSAQSDIYSAGVIFYEMLSGRSPSPDRPTAARRPAARRPARPHRRHHGLPREGPRLAAQGPLLPAPGRADAARPGRRQGRANARPGDRGPAGLREGAVRRPPAAAKSDRLDQQRPLVRRRGPASGRRRRRAPGSGSREAGEQAAGPRPRRVAPPPAPTTTVTDPALGPSPPAVATAGAPAKATPPPAGASPRRTRAYPSATPTPPRPTSLAPRRRPWRCREPTPYAHPHARATPAARGRPPPRRSPPLPSLRC